MDEELQSKQVMTEEQLFKDLQGETVDGGTWKNLASIPGELVHTGPTLKLKKFSSLSKDEQDAEEQHYKELKAANTFVKNAELNSPYMRKVLEKTVKIGGEKITQEELLNKVRGGDYSHMQQLDSVLRNRAATEYMLAHPIPENVTPEEFIENFKTEAKASRKDPVSEMLNPLFRMGISLMINSKAVLPEVAERYRKIDDLLNKEIMMATITKRKCRIDEGSEEDKQRNVRSQVFIMKTLFTSHLGRLQMKKKDGTPPSKDWPYSVANAFTHCSRVMITLPGSRSKEDYYGEPGFKKRGGATHNLELKRKDATKGAEEKKSFTPFNQFGMNIAVGGLGNNGIPAGKTERKIKNDGSCGHLYMHFEKGDEEKHSGMLIGFESDAYGVMNQTGHVHDLKATGEFASSFGGQRCDEIGDKYGGREVDLSKMDPDAYIAVMNLLDSVATRLLLSERGDNEDADADHQIKLNNIAEKLCGNLMEGEQLRSFIQMLYEYSGASDAVGDSIDMYSRLYDDEGDEL